ncbi:hypothetical protein CEXT_236561 [Caerostris extrusa]|uniref:C2H2-type domain-containing protein n=1 Tax=Caerostris extrusa TaxID=172846 RepID=A0AAV4UKQ2_CAEEX|nr:hypothetical protein CEXT_236561 [Caerostris extrusa]
MPNHPGTGNATSSESSSGPFHSTSGLRNPVSSDMGAEGGQNAVPSSENVHQSDDLSFSQRTSNKRNLSDTNNSLTGCSVWNKKTRFCEMNPNESSCQPLDLSIRGASYKTDGISGGEIGSCQKTQSNTSASSTECASSALSSSKNSRDQGKKHVCDVCKKELSSLYDLKRHMRTHTGRDLSCAILAKRHLNNQIISILTCVLTPGRNRTSAKFANKHFYIVQSQARAWVRSTDLWFTVPARFHCATPNPSSEIKTFYQQSVVSIHGPLGYGPINLPLRHSARKGIFYSQLISWIMWDQRMMNNVEEAVAAVNAHKNI